MVLAEDFDSNWTYPRHILEHAAGGATGEMLVQ
jgi:hypothetical protein